MKLNFFIIENIFLILILWLEIFLLSVKNKSEIFENVFYEEKKKFMGFILVPEGNRIQ